ncbi:thiolase family protein [Chloroflexota bacterium]
MRKTTGVAIVASGVCPWGPRKATFRDMIAEAGKACFDSNKKIGNTDIQSLVLSSAMAPRSAHQSAPAPIACEVLGLQPLFHQNTETQCQSGTIAVRTGAAFIMAGLVDLVMVVGVEKQLIPSHEEVFINANSPLDHDWEQGSGITPPGLFAFAAVAHMQKYGTTEEQMAMVSVKNHSHSKTNIAAHFRMGTTLEKVMNSRLIAYPFKLFDCCPQTDGAAAVILASEKKARELVDNPVWLMGIGQGWTAHTSSNIPGDLTDWQGVRLAGQRAYNMAGITPDDVDLAEVHDCFTISEIIQYEALGFCKPGEGGKFVETGQSDYGGKVVFSPRGGLIACGHPFGATGVGQAHEMFLQLGGQAGERQVKDAKIGLAVTMSGCGTQTSAIVYGSEAAI